MPHHRRRECPSRRSVSLSNNHGSACSETSRRQQTTNATFTSAHLRRHPSEALERRKRRRTGPSRTLGYLSRACGHSRDVLVSHGTPELLVSATKRFGKAEEVPNERDNAFPSMVQYFFAQHLGAHKQVSPRTISAYRDTFRLLLEFLETRTGHAASALQITDLDAPVILDFLAHLESERGNTARSRNARLCAIKWFLSRYGRA